MFKDTKAFSSFSVDDIKKAKEFYGQTLGLEVSDSEWGLNIKIAGSNPIFVYSKPNHAPATFTILNFPVESVEKAVDELTTRGVRFEIYKEGELKTNEKGVSSNDDGSKIAWFKDPAGNFLSVMEGMEKI